MRHAVASALLKKLLFLFQNFEVVLSRTVLLDLSHTLLLDSRV